MEVFGYVRLRRISPPLEDLPPLKDGLTLPNTKEYY
jgi:hypothetical protein